VAVAELDRQVVGRGCAAKEVLPLVVGVIFHVVDLRQQGRVLRAFCDQLVAVCRYG